MSMLGEQIRELREAARQFEGYQNGEISRMLREAADTIESLRDRLQEENDALRDYRASQIAVEAERRLQESCGQVPEQGERKNDGERESYAPPLDMLLRCLENDYGIRASWDGLRRVWTTESVTAELDYIEDKSRWFELFGTPERAARTLANNCHRDGCIACAAMGFDCGGGNYDALLEWLREEGEAE